MQNYLPIGSVVVLQGAEKKTIIMGILQFNIEKQDRVYDYLGVPYPQGYLGEGSTYLFNHSDIAEIVSRGYEDGEREAMFELLETLQKEVDKAISQDS